VVTLTKSLALELAPRGITVNAVGPSLIETDLTRERMRKDPRFRDVEVAGTPLGRLGTVEDVAGAVALKAAGYRVELRETGARIAAVYPNTPAAHSPLRETDVIVAVNGKAVHGPSELRALMSGVHPGQSVRVGIRTSGGLRTITVSTIPDPADKSRALMGIEVDQAGSVQLPFPVRINPGAVVGPSAGLAFALEIMEKVGRNVDRGYRVAATGELELNGAILPIGGVEQKTIEARNAHADVMLVPAGENEAATARKYAGTMRVMVVDSFQQALRKLAMLPSKG